jgi:hypothetical protein
MGWWHRGTRCNVQAPVPVQTIGKAANIRQAPRTPEKIPVVFSKTYQYVAFQDLQWALACQRGIREYDGRSGRRRTVGFLFSILHGQLVRRMQGSRLGVHVPTFKAGSPRDQGIRTLKFDTLAALDLKTEDRPPPNYPPVGNRQTHHHSAPRRDLLAPGPGDRRETLFSFHFRTSGARTTQLLCTTTRTATVQASNVAIGANPILSD